MLDEQIAYYRARAPEYDQWFLREGRYDHGLRHRLEWFAEVAEVVAALREARIRGEVLEVAPGTGLWTRHLVETADRVTAIDTSPEAIAINCARIRSARVTYIVADIFDWRPAANAYDWVVFAFWLSHVPPAAFAAFWQIVSDALRPEGRVFFVDSLLNPKTADHDQPRVPGSPLVARRLGDGREFQIVKISYEPAALYGRLEALGWRGAVKATANHFIFGELSHPPSQR